MVKIPTLYLCDKLIKALIDKLSELDELVSLFVIFQVFKRGLEERVQLITKVRYAHRGDLSDRLDREFSLWA